MGERADPSHSELVDIVDGNNQVLTTTTRAEVRRSNLLHRAVSILCRNRDGDVYVHRRTMTKDISPGMYEMFVSGIVQSRETFDDAARRELAEELGVHDIEPRPLFRYLFRGAWAQCWIGVYEVEWDGPFVRQPDEIDWAEFVSWEDLMRIRATWPFTADNVAVFDRYLSNDVASPAAELTVSSGVRILPGLDADVIVVGGGPAGAATASRLARAGLDVIVVEAKRFPRDKVCGDFVGPVALRELDELGVAGVPDYRATNLIRRAAVFIDGEALVSRMIPQVPGLPASGRVIPREILDNWIFQEAIRAGTRVLEETRFTGFVVDEDHVAVHVKSASGAREMRARLLIGADGSTSSVAPALHGKPMRKDNRIIALRAYYAGVGGPEDQADLYFSPESFPGYYWLFPAGRGVANLGVGMVRETLPPTQEHLRTLLDRVISQDGALAARLSNAERVGKVVGFPLTTYDHALSLTGDRVMLVGDAAGLINPLNGEGIQYALLSARWAAETALECMDRADWSEASLAPYTRVVQSELRYDMALANLIVQLIRNRSLNPVWMRALRIIVSRARADPEYAYLAGGILAGLLPARVAMSRKMIGGTIGQATRAAVVTTAVGLARDRRRFGRMGVGGIGVLYKAGYDVIQNPRAARRWSKGLGPALGEFATQAARDRLSRRRKTGVETHRSRSTM